ncbi:MAG: hypothetical protein RI544_04330 [Haloquadratum sp.]|nr:hypothetical protein [Haloquadratum sp.]
MFEKLTRWRNERRLKKILKTNGAGTLQALTVMTGVPIAAVALVAMGTSVVWWRRREGSERSLIRTVLARLPRVPTYHDLYR